MTILSESSGFGERGTLATAQTGISYKSRTHSTPPSLKIVLSPKPFQEACSETDLSSTPSQASLPVGPVLAHHKLYRT